MKRQDVEGAVRVGKKFNDLARQLISEGENRDIILSALLSVAIKDIMRVEGVNEAVRWLRDVANYLESGGDITLFH